MKVKTGQIYITEPRGALIQIAAVHPDKYTVKTYAGEWDVPRHWFDNLVKDGHYRVYPHFANA